MGPDDSEWFAVDAKYAAELRIKVQALYATDIYRSEGTWFPSAAQLRELEIPFQHILQRAGDCITLQGATLHWVRALGFSLHFSWNFGYPGVDQLHQSLLRYHINTEVKIKNLVPMQTLVLDLAREAIAGETLLGVKTREDGNLLALLSKELVSICATFNDLLSVAKRTLSKLPFIDEGEGSAVLMCQNEDCQREIFGAYLACSHCRLTCLRCAVTVCRRGRSFKPLSAMVSHSDATIYIKENRSGLIRVQMMLNTLIKEKRADDKMKRFYKPILSGPLVCKKKKAKQKKERSHSLIVNDPFSWSQKCEMVKEYLANNNEPSSILEAVVTFDSQAFPLGVWLTAQRVHIRSKKLPIAHVWQLVQAVGAEHPLFRGLKVPLSTPPSLLRLNEANASKGSEAENIVTTVTPAKGLSNCITVSRLEALMTAAEEQDSLCEHNVILHQTASKKRKRASNGIGVDITVPPSPACTMSIYETSLQLLIAQLQFSTNEAIASVQNSIASSLSMTNRLVDTLNKLDTTNIVPEETAHEVVSSLKSNARILAEMKSLSIQLASSSKI